jgi:hypothetical protein
VDAAQLSPRFPALNPLWPPHVVYRVDLEVDADDEALHVPPKRSIAAALAEAGVLEALLNGRVPLEVRAHVCGLPDASESEVARRVSEVLTDRLPAGKTAPACVVQLKGVGAGPMWRGLLLWVVLPAEPVVAPARAPRRGRRRAFRRAA